MPGCPLLLRNGMILIVTIRYDELFSRFRISSQRLLVTPTSCRSGREPWTFGLQSECIECCASECNSEFTHTQDTVFIGFHFRLDFGFVLAPPKNSCLLSVFILPTITQLYIQALLSLCLLGILNPLADVILIAAVSVVPLASNILNALILCRHLYTRICGGGR